MHAKFEKCSSHLSTESEGSKLSSAQSCFPLKKLSRSNQIYLDPNCYYKYPYKFYVPHAHGKLSALLTCSCFSWQEDSGFSCLHHLGSWTLSEASLVITDQICEVFPSSLLNNNTPVLLDSRSPPQVINICENLNLIKMTDFRCLTQKQFQSFVDKCKQQMNDFRITKT